MADFPQTPEAINRAEKNRVAELKKRSRVRKIRDLGYKRRYRSDRSLLIKLNRNDIGLSNSIAAGDFVSKMVERHQEFEALQGEGIVHVKNGKPLTEHGAKLLGVPWKGDA